MTLRERLALYGKLAAGLSKGVAIEATLRARGEDAGPVARRNDALGVRLAEARRAIHESWPGDARRLLDQFGRINAQLQAALRDIERGLEVARRAQRAVELLDDALAVTVGLA